jgi:hypothetical protein
MSGKCTFPFHGAVFSFPTFACLLVQPIHPVLSYHHPALTNTIGKIGRVELVYQIAHARTEYKLRTPKAQQDNESDHLTVLSFAIDDLIRTAGSH